MRVSLETGLYLFVKKMQDFRTLQGFHTRAPGTKYRGLVFHRHGFLDMSVKSPAKSCLTPQSPAFSLQKDGFLEVKLGYLQEQ